MSAALFDPPPPCFSAPEADENRRAFMASAIEWGRKHNAELKQMSRRGRPAKQTNHLAEEIQADRRETILFMRSEGHSETSISETLGISRSTIRRLCGNVRDDAGDAELAIEVNALADEGLSWRAIGRRLGIPRSKAHALADPQWAEQQRTRGRQWHREKRAAA